MPKRIYVGLSKLSSSRLKSLSEKSGIELKKLELAARNRGELSPIEETKISKLLESAG